MSRLGKLSTPWIIAGCFLALLLLSFTGLMPVWAQDGAATPPSASTNTTATLSNTVATTVTATETVTAFTDSAAVTITSAPATDASSSLGSSLGYLAFADGALGSGGDFHLQIEGLPPAPTGGQYVLWLRSALTNTYALATFTAATGVDDITGTTGINLPRLFTEAHITLEALPVSPITDTFPITSTFPATMSNRTVVSATLAPTRLERLYPLLYIYRDEEESTYVGEAAATDAIGAEEGVLAAAQTQVDIAVQHTGFLRNALSEDDIPQARRHAEHIINVLDGKNGFMFGDLDRNGLPENPGDGVGVRVYLAAAKSALPTVADLFTATAHLNDSAADVVATVDTGQALITDMFDKALQIFAADTVTEANRFAGELTTLVDDLNRTVDDAHNRTLQLVTYSFAGPPQPVTLPAPAPTVTPIPTDIITEPTTAITTGVTAGITSQVAPTATLRLRPTPTARPRRTATPRAVPTSVPTATPTATSTPLPPLPVLETSALTAPQGGARWQNPVDGTLYVYVPGGSFRMGSEAANAASPKEEPQHEVTVEGFWLQQTETTNAQYARCVAAGACTPPANSRWDDLAFAQHPVSNVTWQQANAYATWAGGRLPTEAEWERTCRGDDDRPYPWGTDAATTDLANYNNAIGDTAPVGSYPAGQSAFGALDLSGNLWEWTSSVELDYPYSADDTHETAALDAGNRTVRGGSFYYTNYQIRCAARTGFAPDTANEHIGFRIVLTEPTAVIRNPVDGAVYIYVSGGSFRMGSEAANAASPKEEPQHEVTVESFWLQQTETTNAQYARCVADGACSPPANSRWDDAAFAQHPVSNVTWQQANAYAMWAGGRLPTEAEWEHTCRGDDGRPYPWGTDAATTDLANYNNAIGDTAPVGSYPAGQSAFGALDLSGNLWEWTSSVELDYPYSADGSHETAALDAGNRTVRGGSFYYTNYQIRCAARTGFAPDTANEHIGFRIVLSVGEE